MPHKRDALHGVTTNPLFITIINKTGRPLSVGWNCGEHDAACTSQTLSTNLKTLDSQFHQCSASAADIKNILREENKGNSISVTFQNVLLNAVDATY